MKSYILFEAPRGAVPHAPHEISNFFSFRAAFISAMYLGASLIFGVMLFKAVVLGVAIYTLLMLQLAQRKLERLGILYFAVAMVVWTELLPLQNLLALTSGQLTQLVQR